MSDPTTTPGQTSEPTPDISPDVEPPKPAEVDPETATDPDGTPTENPSG